MMYTKIKYWIRSRALRIICGRQAPSKIPLSGDRVKKRNYFNAVYLWADDETSFIVDSIDGNNVSGRYWVDDQTGYSNHATLSLSALDSAKFKMHIYKGMHEFIERDEFKFLKNYYLGRYCYRVTIDNFRIWWFGRKPPVLIHRMEVLKTMIDLALTSSDRTFFMTSVFRALYPKEIILHPQFNRIQNEYSLIVSSFEAENLISSLEPNKIRLQPNALSAYNAFFDQKKSETINFRLQTALIIVSFFAFLAAVAQAIPAFLKVCPNLW